jgi:hypothetical protein
MYFNIKNTLKNNYNSTTKQELNAKEKASWR